MFIGHYASALVAYEQHRRAPLWWWLFAAMSLDLVMYAFVGLGIERLELASPGLDVTFPNIDSDMTYTHDLVPVVGWMAIVGGLGFALTRNRTIALWSAGLVLFHEICDLVVGFPHHVMGTASPRVGAALYHEAPFEGWVIEAVLSLACVVWFTTRTPLTRTRSALLYGVLALVCVSTLRLNR